MLSKNNFMQEAINLARYAASIGEVPVGSVVVYKNKIIGKGFNQNIKLKDPTAHAEILAIRDASNIIKNHRLDECDIYTTLEPCLMCIGAIFLSRIKRVYYGASDKKFGANNIIKLDKTCYHRPEFYSDINNKECSEIIQEFFISLRKNPLA